ncbi:type III polyketide synthase [Pseudomonas sp. PH1b]|uniref:type III polyketide synthase n=1 Tax=Pseudomonas sp. PH1b TaxID=1397282 RepID=UPI00046A8846|nr:type III polyketide synthase [Pseudomonas sp. PH1b]BFD42316.1 1,3,6,8-tetrahydroxynaphthalene synthase [Pseudomonas sp. FFPRI_1]
MPTLCLPHVLFPEHRISQQQMIEHLRRLHGDQPGTALSERMIRNSQVQQRHLLLPLDELLQQSDITRRSILYERAARDMACAAARQALVNADLTPSAIRMVIVTSCTGFMMPSLTAHLINDLRLPATTVQLPIAQLGCVAGMAAINRARDFAALDVDNHVLMVSLEFSSLCYQAGDKQLHSLISAALFGDAAGACVLRADDRAQGVRITAGRSYLLPDSEHFIRYEVKNSGFHFALDKAVMHSIKDIAPVLERFNQDHQRQGCADNDFFIFHTGGRKILDELVIHLQLPEDSVGLSRTSLAEAGNVASVAVFDVLRRQFESPPKAGSKGLMAAFGPGFSVEMSLGQWHA